MADEVTPAPAAPAAPASDSRDVVRQLLQKFGFNARQMEDLITFFVEKQATYTNAQILNDWFPTTDAYKERFAGNEARRAAGLRVLSEDQYLALEDSYRAAMRDAQLPSGFYDSYDDFAKFIGNDTSASEMNTRIKAAELAVKNADPAYTSALQDLYGIDPGMMVAHMLDPDRAGPLIEKQAKAVELGYAAKQQGLSVDTQRFEALGMAGSKTGYSADQGFSQIASMLPAAEKLGQVYNDSYSQADAEQEVFGGLASAKRKRAKLGQMEADSFSGNSGVAGGSLSASKTGSF